MRQPYPSLALATLVLCCGSEIGCQKRHEGAERSATGRAGSGGDPGSAGTGPCPVQATFVRLGESMDPGRRAVRYRLRNLSSEPLRSVKLRLRYQTREGASAGEFPLELVRPDADPIAPRATLEEQFDLVGHDGRPEDVTQVIVEVERVVTVAGRTWMAPPAAAGDASP